LLDSYNFNSDDVLIYSDMNVIVNAVM